MALSAREDWYCSIHSKTRTPGGVGQVFRASFRGLPDFKNTRVMLHWIELVESFRNVVSKLSQDLYFGDALIYAPFFAKDIHLLRVLK